MDWVAEKRRWIRLPSVFVVVAVAAVGAESVVVVELVVEP